MEKKKIDYESIVASFPGLYFSAINDLVEEWVKKLPYRGFSYADEPTLDRFRKDDQDGQDVIPLSELYEFIKTKLMQLQIGNHQIQEDLDGSAVDTRLRKGSLNHALIALNALKREDDTVTLESLYTSDSYQDKAAKNSDFMGVYEDPREVSTLLKDVQLARLQQLVQARFLAPHELKTGRGVVRNPGSIPVFLTSVESTDGYGKKNSNMIFLTPDGIAVDTGRALYRVTENGMAVYGFTGDLVERVSFEKFEEAKTLPEDEQDFSVKMFKLLMEQCPEYSRQAKSIQEFQQLLDAEIERLKTEQQEREAHLKAGAERILNESVQRQADSDSAILDGYTEQMQREMDALNARNAELLEKIGRIPLIGGLIKKRILGSTQETLPPPTTVEKPEIKPIKTSSPTHEQQIDRNDKEAENNKDANRDENNDELTI